MRLPCCQNATRPVAENKPPVKAEQIAQPLASADLKLFSAVRGSHGSPTRWSPVRRQAHLGSRRQKRFARDGIQFVIFDIHRIHARTRRPRWRPKPFVSRVDAFAIGANTLRARRYERCSNLPRPGHVAQTACIKKPVAFGADFQTDQGSPEPCSPTRPRSGRSTWRSTWRQFIGSGWHSWPCRRSSRQACGQRSLRSLGKRTGSDGSRCVKRLKQRGPARPFRPLHVTVFDFTFCEDREIL